MAEPSIDAEYLVTGAMVVVKGVNSVSPRICPLIFRKTFLKRRGRIFITQFDCSAVEKNWVPAIGNRAIILEDKLLGLPHGCA